MYLRANGEQRQNFIKITHDPQSSCLTLILKSWTSTVNDEKVQPQKISKVKSIYWTCDAAHRMVSEPVCIFSISASRSAHALSIS